MPLLLLFIILSICGLINSYFFSPKFVAWLRSLLQRVPLLKPRDKVAKKEIEEKEASMVMRDKEELETMFATFDRDGDGFITANELEESLRRLGLFTTNKEIVAMMEKVDTNRDGLIDLEEFRKLYVSFERIGGEGSDGRDEGQREEEERDLKEAFDVFDENGDGLITVQELALVLNSLGLKQGLKEEDCREMIKKVDLDGDGTVNFDEFKKMMTAKGGKIF